MKPKLILSQSQKMILSPQAKLYLKVLQMPLQDLRQSLLKELSQNPLLEEDPNCESTSSEESIEEKEQSMEVSGEASINEDTYEPLVDPRELARRKDYQESILTQSESLIDHIHSQLSLLSLTKSELKWVDDFIGSLDENGFLTEDLSSVTTRLQIPEYRLEKLLKKLQQLDPPGIFARSLGECLALQLQERTHQLSSIARDMVLHNFHLIQKRSFKELSRIYQKTLPEIEEAYHLIQELDPKPGKAFASASSSAIVPDVILTTSKEKGKKYDVTIKGSGLPTLRINSEYQSMAKNKGMDEKTKKFLKENVEKAAWLLEALDYRKTTLASIVKIILDAQSNFVDKGLAHLKPLRMKDVAVKLGIHESTVSRAASGKYIQTPLGTYPIRSLFSGKISSEPGEDESQKSVMERIKGLIDKEDLKKPLSDQKIVALLEESGIKIARRTVAKYRDMLKILPTNLRRQR